MLDWRYTWELRPINTGERPLALAIRRLCNIERRIDAPSVALAEFGMKGYQSEHPF